MATFPKAVIRCWVKKTEVIVDEMLVEVRVAQCHFVSFGVGRLNASAPRRCADAACRLLAGAGVRGLGSGFGGVVVGRWRCFSLSIAIVLFTAV